MSLYKCPGSFKRELDSDVLTCPACGRELEIFSDEPMRTCRCGEVLRRETRPQCANWCPAAVECLGGTIDLEEHRRRIAQLRDDPKAKEYVECIRRQLAGAGERKDG